MPCKLCGKVRRLVRKKRISYSEPYYEGYGQFQTVESFRAQVRTGTYTDYNGYGYAAYRFPDDTVRVSHDIMIRPSKIHLIPTSATHIVWYNR